MEGEIGLNFHNLFSFNPVYFLRGKNAYDNNKLLQIVQDAIKFSGIKVTTVSILDVSLW